MTPMMIAMAADAAMKQPMTAGQAAHGALVFEGIFVQYVLGHDPDSLRVPLILDSSMSQ